MERAGDRQFVERLALRRPNGALDTALQVDIPHRIPVERPFIVVGDQLPCVGKLTC
jgi:hypothetical protein